MLKYLFKIPLLRMKYKFFPSEAQAFWAEELMDDYGLASKMGQILSQGKKTRLPKSSLAPSAVSQKYTSTFHTEFQVTGEVLAASMGQVFFGQIHSQQVAVKVLHPGIKEKLKKEIDNIILLGGYFSKAKNFYFNKNIFKQFLEEVFEEETDLNRECLNQNQFYQIFKHHPLIKIPEVYKELSNDEFLTQKFVSCTLARDMYTIDQFEIFDFLFKALFEHGLLHGDLNDRNWGVEGKSTVVYDFGCSQIISPRRINGLKKLISNQDIINGFLEFGIRLETSSFKGREQFLRDALFGPLFERTITPELKYSQELQEQFGEDIKQLRQFTDPWVLLFMRSLFSLIKIYQERNVAIPLNSLIQPYLKDHELKAETKKIKILVTEGKTTIVSMKLPLSSLENLLELMPPHINEKLKHEKINFNDLIEKIKASNYSAQDIFKLTSAPREYHVWIE